MNELDEILALALQSGAAAIHLFEGEAPAARLKGKLHPLPFPPVSRQQAILWLQPLAGRDGWSEMERAGIGRILYPTASGLLFRGRFSASEQGIGIVLFPVLSPPPIDPPTLPPTLRHLADLRGLVLIAGGIATGKTTLLGSLVAWLASVHCWRILALEEEPALFSYRSDPGWISHWEIPRDFPDMTTALDSPLARDADAVAIDPLRTVEEIEAALDLAESGKLVLATHEAEGGAAAVASLIRTLQQGDRSADTDRLATTLRLAVCQTLLQRQDGNGIALLHEILPGHPAVAAAIRAGALASLGEFVQVGSEGGRHVDDAILDLWKEGVVSTEEALRHAREEERLLSRLEGMRPGVASSRG